MQKSGETVFCGFSRWFLCGLLAGVLLCVADGQDPVHFVVDDHEAFVHAHAGLGQDLDGLGGHGAVDADLGAAVGFVAGAALVSADALLLAVEHGLDGVVDAAQVGGLDLDHVAGLVVGEQLDVLQGVAPLVGNQLHVAATAIQLGGEAGQRLHLGGNVHVAVHGAFDAELEGLGDLAQLLDIVSHGGVVGVAEGSADGAVHVDVEHGIVVLAGAVSQNAVPEPCHILGQLLTILAQLLFHVVDQSVRQNLCALDDHLVGVGVAVITVGHGDGSLVP